MTVRPEVIGVAERSIRVVVIEAALSEASSERQEQWKGSNPLSI